jgi:hypothetical protein
VRVGSWSWDWGIGRIQPKERFFIGFHSLPRLRSPESVLQYFATQGYSWYSQCTLIHCSVRRHDSMLRATTAGWMRLSSSSSRPPCLDDAASGMGDKRINADSSMMGSRTTTSVLASGSGSTRFSTLSSGANVAQSRGLFLPLSRQLVLWAPSPQ